VAFNEGYPMFAFLDDLKIYDSNTGSAQNKNWRINLRALNDLPAEIYKIEVKLIRTSNKLLSIFNNATNELFFTKNVSLSISNRSDVELIFEHEFSQTELDLVMGSVLNNKTNYKASGKIYYKSKHNNKELVLDFQNVNVQVY